VRVRVGAGGVVELLEAERGGGGGGAAASGGQDGLLSRVRRQCRVRAGPQRRQKARRGARAPSSPQEEPAPPAWRVSRSSLPSLPQGSLVALHDTTPRGEAPAGARGAEGLRSLRLRSSDADPGAIAYNGVGGVSLEGYPRDYDGVNVSFTVWSCAGATGSCSVLEDAEDPGALVCEFGPQVIREGLTSMLPGETRRFWISADTADRRFGRPLPERVLPMGPLVVDMTLRSIEREAVFSYIMTPESRKLIEERENRPETILLRGVGVGVQFLPWAYYYLQSAEQADSFVGPFA